MKVETLSVALISLAIQVGVTSAISVSNMLEDGSEPIYQPTDGLESTGELGSESLYGYGGGYGGLGYGLGYGGYGGYGGLGYGYGGYGDYGYGGYGLGYGGYGHGYGGYGGYGGGYGHGYGGYGHGHGGYGHGYGHGYSAGYPAYGYGHHGYGHGCYCHPKPYYPHPPKCYCEPYKKPHEETIEKEKSCAIASALSGFP